VTYLYADGTRPETAVAVPAISAVLPAVRVTDLRRPPALRTMVITPVSDVEILDFR
jgi:hypothetical protein